jgi:hypothetical protein
MNECYIWSEYIIGLRELYIEVSKTFKYKGNKTFLNFRVPEEKLLSRKKRALESWANLNGLYCVCQKGKQGVSAEALCSSTQYLDCEMQKSITKTKCYIYSFRKKRSPAAHEKEMDRLFALMQPVGIHDVKKVSNQGWKKIKVHLIIYYKLILFLHMSIKHSQVSTLKEPCLYISGYRVFTCITILLIRLKI